MKRVSVVEIHKRRKEMRRSREHEDSVGERLLARHAPPVCIGSWISSRLSSAVFSSMVSSSVLLFRWLFLLTPGFVYYSIIRKKSTLRFYWFLSCAMLYRTDAATELFVFSIATISDFDFQSWKINSVNSHQI